MSTSPPEVSTWALIVPSPKGTSVITWFIRTACAGGLPCPANSSRIFLASATHSSLRNLYGTGTPHCSDTCFGHWPEGPRTLAPTSEPRSERCSARAGTPRRHRSVESRAMAVGGTRAQRLDERVRNEKWQNPPFLIDMSICINCDTCLRHCPPQF